MFDMFEKHRLQLLFIPIVAFALTAGSGCVDRDQYKDEPMAVGTEQADVQVQEARSVLEASLQLAEKQITQLEDKLANAGNDTRNDLQQTISRLREESAELRLEIAELEYQSAQEFEYAQNTLNERVEDLESAITEARLAGAESSDELSTMISTSLNEASERVDSLEAEVVQNEMNADSSKQYLLDETRAQRDSLAALYEQLESASEEQFKEIRSDAARVAASLERQLDDAADEIDSSLPPSMK